MRVFPLIVPIIVLIIMIILFQTVFAVGYVPSDSMEPTIDEGSMIIGYRLFDDLKKGDIIVFRHEGQLLVKRIAGAPGDSIESAGGSFVVPEDCYYVLGDNAANSHDSRYWEDPFVRRENIVAVVLSKNKSK